MTKAVIYARFSCDKQRDASIDDQLRLCRQYCETHQYEIVQEYTDYAESGMSDDRPQFLRMIHDADKGGFEVLVVWKLDRFARNQRDTYVYEAELDRCGVRIESVMEKISGKGMEPMLNKSILSLFAQIRSMQGAEDTMRGMTGKALKCQYLGYPTFGYSHEGDVITINEAEAEIVREVFDRCIGNQTVTEIRDWLRSIDVKTTYGNPPGYQFVYTMLKNEKYRGVYQWGRKKDDWGNDLKGADGKYVPLVRIERGVPAIVDDETWFLAQKHLKLHNRREVRRHDYVLTGKLQCGICGKPMRGESYNSKGKHYTRYTCSGKRSACSGPMSQEKIESGVAKTVRAVLGNPELVERIIAEHLEYQKAQGESASRQAAEGNLKIIRTKRDNLINSVAEGMPYELVSRQIEELSEEESALEAVIADLDDEKAVCEADMKGFLEAVSRGWLEDKQLIDGFVYKVLAYEDKFAVITNMRNADTSPLELELSLEEVRTSPQVSGGVRTFTSWCPTQNIIRLEDRIIEIVHLRAGFAMVSSW